MVRAKIWIFWCILLLAAAGCGNTDLPATFSDQASAPDFSPDFRSPTTSTGLSTRVPPQLMLPEPEGDEPVILGNGLIEIVFDETTGQVREINDLRQDPPLALLDPNQVITAVPPFEIDELVKGPLGLYQTVTMKCPVITPLIQQESDRVALIWDGAPDCPTVEAAWELTPDSPEVQITAQVSLEQNHLIRLLRYPILTGLLPLDGDGTADQYLISLEGGALLRDPRARLAEEIANNLALLRDFAYPLGHVSMTQMVAYLHEGVGGMLLYTADPSFGAKSFRLDDRSGSPAAAKDGLVLSWEVDHYNPDVNDDEGTDAFDIGYPVVLRWLDKGSWYEAAERYREWSDEQEWAADPIAGRDAGEREFYEKVGASIFGLSSRVDQRPWIEAFHDALVGDSPNAKLLYVFGWDFHPMGVPAPKNYNCFVQGGWDEAFWVPFAGKARENFAQARGQGDYAMPFYYDLMVGSKMPGWDQFFTRFDNESDPHGSFWKHLLIGASGRPTGYVYYDEITGGFVYTLDPADPFVGNFWRWRDALIVSQFDPPLDGLYFDLGFSVILWDSFDSFANLDNGHPSGSGRWLIQSVRDNLSLPRGTPNPRGFRYGAENVSEPYVDLVDFWHLGGAGVGPIRSKVKDSDPPVFNVPDKWFMEGNATDVPLMQYLHHHNGTLRTGGKIQASYSFGDVFYWITALEYIWGGVVELIYFNTPVDWLPSLDPLVACKGAAAACAFQTGWIQSNEFNTGRHWYGESTTRRADPAKLDFLHRAIHLRVDTAAGAYLTKGRMEAPPTLDPEPAPIAYSYNFYSSIVGPRYYHSGTYTAPPVLRAAWRHPTDDKIALMVANASAATIDTDLVADPSLYGLAATCGLREVNLGEASPHAPAAAIHRDNGKWRVTVSLEPYSFRMFELGP